MTRLAMIRHGHTAWNRAGRIQGRSDIPLDEDARRDLAALALPGSWADAQLVASPLVRAQDTAELIAGRAPETAPELIEMHWGDWEGQQGKVLRDTPGSGFKDIEHWGWNYCPPGGESPKQVWDRVAPWVQALRQDTVAVTHMGVMRVLLARATGWGFRGPAPFRIKRNRLYILSIDPDLRLAVPDPVRLIPADPP